MVRGPTPRRPVGQMESLCGHMAKGGPLWPWSAVGVERAQGGLARARAPALPPEGTWKLETKHVLATYAMSWMPAPGIRGRPKENGPGISEESPDP